MNDGFRDYHIKIGRIWHQCRGINVFNLTFERSVVVSSEYRLQFNGRWYLVQADPARHAHLRSLGRGDMRRGRDGYA